MTKASEPKAASPYPQVDSHLDLPALETATLDYWNREAVFQRSIDQRSAGEGGENEYVFYDGPPFANGLPHYGHLITSYIKDIVPRYQTLRGRRVERRFGWDCHGLPAELEAEKELGVSGRSQIIEYGIARFNDQCRTSVLRYTDEWQQTIGRAARWVDFENDYKTLNPDYMESVIWALKQLHDRGLLYEGYRVMPYSWAAQTPLSNFETRLDDAYRERQDPAVTVGFELVAESGEEAPCELLAWTTTPWTLPSNLALAVGPEIDYAVFEIGERRVILAAARAEAFANELEGGQRVGELRGSELAGRRYRPLFPFFSEHPGAFRVLEADFVDTEEGTGVVHLAPGFGEDDMAVCSLAGIEVVCPVDDAGCFTDEVSDWAGLQVFETNTKIIRSLRESGRLFRSDTIVHSYPHCWRTDTPLIYRAMNSWYVKVSAIRERMVELNQQIAWIPEHVRDGLFGKWLEGARDWSISRNRFWGTPIPIWKSDDPAYPRVDVYGSLDEIEADFGVRPTDLHRPFIDELVRPNPDDPSGKSQMRRVEEVLDGWFESGSMPFAQAHYPFENKEWFEDHFPADFITEYMAQTRGWFYTMMVLATALFDRPPFRNCICHGLVLDSEGKKLSKRLRNYPDPAEVFDTIGSDALRWFLVSSPVMRGGEIRIGRDGKQIAESVRQAIHPLWNAYAFFTLYANADGVRANPIGQAEGLLDRYILAKTRLLVEGLERDLDAYEISIACHRVVHHLDALNNWYIRRSRSRFWSASGDDASKQAAYDTLYTVLVTLCRAVSPLLPFVSEAIFRGFTGEPSVHLTDWPESEDFALDTALVESMDRARDVCSVALSLRAAHDIRVRQPLAELLIAGANLDGLSAHAALIADEVNVKAIRFSDEIDAYATFELKVNARAVGPRLGGETKAVIAASKRGEWEAAGNGRVRVAGHILEASEFEWNLRPKEGIACESLPGNDAIVVLDLAIDESLREEGRVRDLIRAVQQSRKDAGLNVSDRIALYLELPENFQVAVERHRDTLLEQTLSVEIRDLADFSGSSVSETLVGDAALRIGIERVEPR
ncbi:MAG: isoleucine--tRNA ligase [Myxococcota bacterium]